jgi:hypothetical protein
VRRLVASIAVLWLGAAQGAWNEPALDKILARIDREGQRSEEACSTREDPIVCIARTREHTAKLKDRAVLWRLEARTRTMAALLKPEERLALKKLGDDWKLFIMRACPLRASLHARRLSGTYAKPRTLQALAACRLEHRKAQLTEIETLERPIPAPAVPASAASGADVGR